MTLSLLCTSVPGAQRKPSCCSVAANAAGEEEALAHSSSPASTQVLPSHAYPHVRTLADFLGTLHATCAMLHPSHQHLDMLGALLLQLRPRRAEEASDSPPVARSGEKPAAVEQRCPQSQGMAEQRRVSWMRVKLSCCPASEANPALVISKQTYKERCMNGNVAAVGRTRPRPRL